MNQSYDIFISYRRDDGAQYARILQLELEKRGYKVFLDYEELKDGVFGDNIKDALKSTPIFLMVLTPLYLERCMEQDSWVREEIELAIKSGMHFIPVDPDKKFNGTPQGTPKEIASIVNNHQHSAIDFGQALGATVDLMDINRIRPHLGNKSQKGAQWGKIIFAVVLVVGLIAGCLLYFLPNSNTSGGYQKAYDDQLISAAEQGDPKAQYYLGLVFENGYGIAANTSTAVEWYKRAAEQGLDSAQVNLGMCYLQGTGITQDETEGVRWLTKAADNGNTDAMTNLGVYFYNKNDASTGMEWLRKAADQGNGKAKQIIEEIKK